MTSLPRLARLYILLLYALMLCIVVVSIFAIVSDINLGIPILIVAIGIYLLDASPIALAGEKMEVTLSGSVKFAAIATYLPPVAILGNFIGTGLSELRARRPWFKKLFNIAEMTISISVQALLFRAIYQPEVDYFGSLRNIVAILFAGLVGPILSAILVSLIVSLATQEPFFHTWSQSARQVSRYELSVGPLGVILAILWQYNPLSIVLAIGLFVIIKNSYGIAIQLHKQTNDALRALMQVIDERDHHTYNHSERVSKYAQSIAQALGLPPDEIEVITPAALLHDLGKVGMIDDVLFGAGTLNPDELQHAKKHAEVGALLLSKFPLFEKGALLVKHHHERFDGKGYPDGLKGEEIPLGARIISVADAYQAMTEARTYRQALSPSEAIQELVNGSGTQFDPQVVDAFVQVMSNGRK